MKQDQWHNYLTLNLKKIAKQIFLPRELYAKLKLLIEEAIYSFWITPKPSKRSRDLIIVKAKFLLQK